MATYIINGNTTVLGTSSVPGQLFLSTATNTVSVQAPTGLTGNITTKFPAAAGNNSLFNFLKWDTTNNAFKWGNVLQDYAQTYSPGTQVLRKLALCNKVYNFASATLTTTTFGLTFGAGNVYNGGVIAQNGNIYFVPGGVETLFTIINTTAGTAVKTNFGFVVTSSWWPGALAPNGLIYNGPIADNRVLVINPAAATVFATTFGLTLPTNSNIYTGANGLLYGTSSGVVTNIYVINPATNTATVTNFGIGSQLISEMVLAPNGKLYACPSGGTTIYVINTLTNSAYITTFGLTIPTTASFVGAGALGADGNIYFAPNSHSLFFVINPTAETAFFTTFGLSFTGGFSGTVNGADGNIYFIKRNANNFIKLNPLSGSAITVTSATTTDCINGVLSSNGTVYCPPFTLGLFRLIKPSAAPGIELEYVITPNLNHN